MALMKNFTLIIFALFSISAFADSRVIVSAQQCETYEYLPNKKWGILKESFVKKGDKLLGNQSENGFIFKKDDQIYFIKNGCFTAADTQKEESSPSQESAQQSQETLESSPSLPNYWEFYGSIFSIQEPLVLTTGAQNYNLLGIHTGLCAGVSHQRPINEAWVWGGVACAMAGISEVAESTGETSVAPLNYRVKSSKIFGLQLGPHLYWRPTQNTMIGMVVPLFLHIGSYPSPTSSGLTYQVTPSPVISPGLFFDTRMGWEKVSLSFKFGFFRSFSAISWMLGTYVRL